MMNTAEKNRVLLLEEKQYLLFEEIKQAKKSVVLARKIGNKVILDLREAKLNDLEKELSILEKEEKKIIGFSRMVPRERLFMNYKPEDCEYCEMPDGSWQQVIIRGDRLVDWWTG